MADPRISLDEVEIGSFCRRNRIHRLALFGSVLRDDFGPESTGTYSSSSSQGSASVTGSSRSRMISRSSSAAASTSARLRT